MLDDNNDIEIEITSTDLIIDNKKDESIDKQKPPKKPEKKKQSQKDSVEKLLWNVAKKYKTLLDKGIVPQISESEEDRIEVSDAYQEIENKRHRQLDARVYQSLTKMQKTRDSKIALEGTTERDRLRMIAWEVKIRTQAIVFFPGDSTLDMNMFNAYDHTGIQIIEGDEKEILIEDDIIENKGIAILESLPLRKLTKEQKGKLKQEFLKKFRGKRFKITELENKIDSISADLISLLVREKQILLLKREQNIVEIMAYPDKLTEFKESDLLSRSIVLTPKKTKN